MRYNGLWAFRPMGGRLIKTLGYAVCALACMVLAFGCGGRRHDGRLVHAAEIVSESPKEALALIDSIDRDSLSEADRHYLDFIKIKASDKAYILHQSDSLILDVINYASSHKDEGSVSSRRSGLAKKIFESDSKIDLLDKLILLL